MKLLLTSGGITNKKIADVLLGLVGKIEVVGEGEYLVFNK